MFLFVSHTRFKQAGLSAAVLLLSLSAHADLSEAAEKSLTDTQPGVASDSRSLQDRRIDGSAQNYRFPHWPRHMQSGKTVIPPPPPGPYKSSALNDYSVSAPAAPVKRSVQQQPQLMRDDSASMPMDMFSPDVPWPTNLRPEQPVPEHRLFNSGQHYTRSPSRQAPAMQGPSHNPAIMQRYGNYNYGKRQGAYSNRPHMNNMGMNVPGMSGSRWRPSMSVAPPGPYNSRSYNDRWNYAPNFSPDGRSNYRPNYGSQRYDSRYARPMINNSDSVPVNPAYR